MQPVDVFVPVEIVGGHERMLISLLQRAQSLGVFRPVVHCGNNTRLLQWIKEAGLEVANASAFELEKVSRFGRIKNAFSLYRMVRNSVNSGRAPLIAPGSIQSATIFTLAAVLASSRVTVYVPMAFPTATMNFRFPALRDWIAARIANRVGAWITISRDQSELLSGYWNLKSPIDVIPNSNAVVLDELAFRPPLAGRRLELLYVGRFDVNQKGLDLLIGFFLAHPELMGKFRLTLKGAHGEAAQVDRLVEQLKQRDADFVAVEGWGDPRAAYARADALILSSRFEGVPLVALEAMAAGLPVAASRQAGLVDLLPPAALFEVGSDQQLVELMSRMLVPGQLAEWREYELRTVRAYLDPDQRDEAIRRYAARLPDLVDTRAA